MISRRVVPCAVAVLVAAAGVGAVQGEEAKGKSGARFE